MADVMSVLNSVTPLGSFASNCSTIFSPSSSVLSSSRMLIGTPILVSVAGKVIVNSLWPFGVV